MLQGKLIYKITFRERKPPLAYCYEKDLIEVVNILSHDIEKIEPFAEFVEEKE